MAIPSVQVFLGEETAGIDGAVTWVDITTYLRFEYPVTRSYGRSYGGGAQPGTASLTLENTDARFTVGNASSPLYPYVRLQALVKILRDGRPFFVGRIQAMPMSWPDSGDSLCIVTVSLADKMARYERIMLDAYAVEEILSTGPAAYWPMTDPSGSTGAGNIVAVPWPLRLTTPGDGTVVFGSGTAPAGDGRSVCQFTPGTVPATLSGTGAFDNTASLNGSGYATSISAAFSTTVGGVVVHLNTGGNIPRTIDISVGIYAGNAGVRIVLNDPTGPWAPTFPCAVLDGATHIVTLMFNTGGLTAPDQMQVYVDGVAITRSGGFGGIAGIYSLSADVRVGQADPVDAGSSYTTAPFAGSIGHVALWTRPVTAAEAAQIATALEGTILTTQTALTKILGWRNQGATALIDAGVSDGIPSIQIGGGSLASRLNMINDSEAGTLYVDGQDRLTWKNRRTLLSPMLTLTNDDITAPTYNCEIQGIVTKVTATQLGTSTIVQSADITTIGEMTGSVTSISNVDGDGTAHASALANGAPRGPYIGSLTIDLATLQATPFAQAITGDILAGVTLTGMPSQTPPGSTVLEVIGVTERLSATSWDLTWNTQPAGIGSARDVMVWDDPTFGFWDAGHRWAY